MIGVIVPIDSGVIVHHVSGVITTPPCMNGHDKFMFCSVNYNTVGINSWGKNKAEIHQKNFWMWNRDLTSCF